MGLLDQLAGMSPEQNQGLLAAAAQMLQASGPSRMPTSFGQVLGTGLQGYQTGLSAAQEAAQKKALMEQAAALNGFKLRDAESDFNNQEAARKRAQELAAASRGYFGGGSQAAPAFPAPQSAAATMQGMVTGGDPAQAAPPAAQAPAGNKTLYQQHLDYADFLRKQGYGPEADAQEEKALKFQPKVKGWEKVQKDGKVMFAPFYEDGTSGQPVPLEVAEKLEKVNRGGTTDLTNAYTGAVVASLKNSVSPDAQLSASTQMRGQNMTDARARESLTQGKIPAGYRATANGGLEAIPGGPAADKVTSPQQKVTDAKDVIALLDQAKPLIEKATGSYGGAAIDQGARLFGVSTDGAQSAAQLKALEGMLVSKMPKMSGPQSDKDVLLYKQMAGQIGDTTIPKDTKLAAMATIREINQRYIDSTPNKPLNPARGSEQQSFNMLPPAKDYDGKRMKSDNGTVYRSTNGKWVKE